MLSILHLLNSFFGGEVDELYDELKEQLRLPNYRFFLNTWNEAMSVNPTNYANANEIDPVIAINIYININLVILVF